MSVVGLLKSWLEKPPVIGSRALVGVFGAVVLPTIIRWMVDGNVSGVAFLPYIPFVLVAAILLGWRYAASVAVISAYVADLLFIEPRFQPLAGPTAAFGSSYPPPL